MTDQDSSTTPITEEERRGILLNLAVRIVHAEMLDDLVLVLCGTGMHVASQVQHPNGTIQYTIKAGLPEGQTRPEHEGTPTWPGARLGEFCPDCGGPYDHQPGGAICVRAQRVLVRPAP